MLYEETRNNIVYFYNVTYDKEKLNEILKKLEKYSYTVRTEEKIAGNITKWPVTKNILEKRIFAFFNATKNQLNLTLYPETIKHCKEDGNDYITYEYSYTKMPDLYHYINIMINNKDIMDYVNLFGYVTGELNMLYAIAHKEQLIIEGLINYINSKELINHNPENNEEINNNKYDYKGLNELYKETLECFELKLIAKKEYLDTQEIIPISSLQRKNTLYNN